MASVCAPGCLRPIDHVGLCLTIDGVQPPSIKRIHTLAKRSGCCLTDLCLEEPLLGPATPVMPKRAADTSWNDSTARRSRSSDA